MRNFYFSTTHAAVPVGTSATGAIALQGGSDSTVKYSAPATTTYKAHVFVPKTGTTTNALYRVYPNGKRPGSTQCLSTDVKFPCHEVTVDQTQHQNAWTQLTVNNDAATQWDFVKGKGYVTAVASNLGMTEWLNLTGQVRFEATTLAIGKSFGGGIIFYLDEARQHGLVAAPTDQSTGIQWWNGASLSTGATAKAVGTGRANTAKIISMQGAGAYAAKLTADLVLGGYDDWFLPSVDELNLMYKNIGNGAAAPLTNVGGFASGGYYWSSSEDGRKYAWTQSFASGGQYYSSGDKYFPFYVRAVRGF